MDNDTLFNEDDEKKKNDKNKKDDDMEELDLEDEDEDIIPIEETGGSGRKILWTIVVLIIIGLGIYSFARREQIRESLQTPEEEGEITEEAAEDVLEEFTWETEEEEDATSLEEEDEQVVIKESELPELEEFAEEKPEEIAQVEEEPEEVKPTEEIEIPTEEVKPSEEQPSLEPKIEMRENEIVAKAQSGEGITHLARRALSEYLEKNNRQDELSSEQKIFIEDYLQNRTGTENLHLGESRTFTVAHIEEAVNASKQLNETQLKNLEKYAQVVFHSAGS